MLGYMSLESWWRACQQDVKQLLMLTGFSQNIRISYIFPLFLSERSLLTSRPCTTKKAPSRYAQFSPCTPLLAEHPLLAKYTILRRCTSVRE